ncbi:AsmA family protein [Enhydrobacter sp.]|jgi:uncharacterized protein involved in outer membrane biogenesis|uniref:AsmA family protein n=1 Tax=Enhydrobacter sp. TaxID=1894999 RepID=UPI00261CE3BF|nr:AsmA family protein [Enhydrobacter sp.]WIM14296.1 MAG: hypothetical protein OJF58_005266 [Enhydrobacter sp.]
MARIAKILGWSAGILVVLGVVAAGALYLFATSTWVRSQVEGRASAYSGRTTTIGDIRIDWGSTAHVRLENVQVANSSWGKAPYMLKADEVDFDIRLWPLLRGDFVLPHLTLRKPEVYIERNDKGQTNWDFGQSPVTVGAAKAVAPRERHQTPLVGRLEIDDGRVGYSDLERKIELGGTISTATGEAGGQPEAKLDLAGKLENQPLEAHFVGGSALMLRQTDKPYPVALDIAYGATRLTVKGTLQDPIQWKGANVDITLAGPNLADVYPLLGIPGPRTSPYRITGRLDREPGIWKVTGSTWHVGDSDLAGDIAIDERRTPSHLTARLVSQHLAFADLAPVVGASPGKRGNVSQQQAATERKLEAEGELFPDVPLHFERLRAMDMDVSLDARRVVAPSYLPVTALALSVHVENGVATVHPLDLAIAGGGASGEIRVDAHADTPRVRADLALRNLDFGAFFRGSRFFDATRGKIQGRVSIAGAGRSLAEIMGGANGQVALAMAGGSVSDLMVSLAGLQIVDALVLYVTGDHRIPIHCALGRLDIERGTATFEKTVLDTQKSVLHVEGRVGLRSQVVDVTITTDPKKFDLLDLHGPVTVKGKIRKPVIAVKVPIPHPVIGDARDVACQALTERLLSGKP